MNWSAENISLLKLYWPDHSARYIATMFGCTRNAVIGKAHRLRLPLKKFGHPGQRIHYPRDRKPPSGRVLDGKTESDKRADD